MTKLTETQAAPFLAPNSATAATLRRDRSAQTTVVWADGDARERRLQHERRKPKHLRTTRA